MSAGDRARQRPHQAAWKQTESFVPGMARQQSVSQSECSSHFGRRPSTSVSSYVVHVKPSQQGLFEHYTRAQLVELFPDVPVDAAYARQVGEQTVEFEAL